MLLSRAIIHNYGCLEPDAVLDVHPHLTCLTGATESGKSRLLMALHSFNSDHNYGKADRCSFDEERRKAGKDDPVITLIFAVSESDKRTIFKEIPPEAKTEGEIHVTKAFSGKYTVRGLDEHLQAQPRPADVGGLRDDLLGQIARLRRSVVRHARETGQDTTAFAAAVDEARRRLLEKQEADNMAWAFDAVRPVFGNLGLLSDETASIDLDKARRRFADRIMKQLTRSVDEWGRKNVANRKGSRIMDALPRFEFVESEVKYFLQGEVDLGEFERAEATDPRFLPARSLLRAAGLTVEELRIRDREERLDTLDRASSRITRALAQVWSQGSRSHRFPPVSIDLEMDGDTLLIRVLTEGGHRGFPESRSKGFQWFLTFYLTFLGQTSSQAKQVLLLDEPGIHLHPAGQRDLLRELRRISQNTQVVYATHSAELIDVSEPKSWRLLEFAPERGSLILNDLLGEQWNRRGLDAIGAALGSTMDWPYWPLMLVVEGPADKLYIETVARIMGREEPRYAPLFNGEVHVMASKGVSAMEGQVAYCTRPDVTIAALLDSDSPGDSKAKKLVADGYLPKEAVIQVNVAYDSKNKHDVEDILGLPLLSAGIRRAYHVPAAIEIHQEGLPKGEGLGGRLKKFVADGGLPGVEDLNKWEVARAVQEILAGDPAKLTQDCRTRFAKIFAALLDALGK